MSFANLPSCLFMGMRSFKLYLSGHNSVERANEKQQQQRWRQNTCKVDDKNGNKRLSTALLWILQHHFTTLRVLMHRNVSHQRRIVEENGKRERKSYKFGGSVTKWPTQNFTFCPFLWKLWFSLTNRRNGNARLVSNVLDRLVLLWPDTL